MILIKKSFFGIFGRIFFFGVRNFGGNFFWGGNFWVEEKTQRPVAALLEPKWQRFPLEAGAAPSKGRKVEPARNLQGRKIIGGGNFWGRTLEGLTSQVFSLEARPQPSQA